MTASPTARPASSWLTVDEVAALAGAPAAEIRRAVAHRKLNGVSTHPASGGDWMFRQADVDAWLAAR
jgi:excisionase family DNA binding protein